VTILAHKIALDPTPSQRVALAKSAGCARVAYNWGLAEWNRQYEAYKADNTLPKPKAALIRKQWNSVKHDLYPWMSESPKDANIEALYDLEAAFKALWKGNAKYPRFHVKGRHAPSFGVSNDKFRLERNRVRLPVIGWIKTREALRFEGKILSGRVTCKAGRWYLSVQVEMPENYARPSAPANTAVGVDLGVSALAVLSDGTMFANPRALQQEERRLHRYILSIARKQRAADKKHGGPRKKGEHREISKRLVRERRRMARTQARVANVRNDALHKITTMIARSFKTVVIEDLAIRNLTKACKGKGRAAKAGLNRSILAAGLGEFRRQIEYKVPLHGGSVIAAPRFFPSTRTCCGCNSHKKLSLRDRMFVCGSCGLSVNRDLNAAINLRTAGLAGNYARGHYVNPTQVLPELVVVEILKGKKREIEGALTSAHLQ